MPTLKQRDVQETEVEITPDYCFSRAAQALTPDQAHYYSGNPAEYAREWRLLGEALHFHTDED